MTALSVTEGTWKRTVIETAQAFGWRVAHFRPARTEQGWRTPVEADGAGFPDLVMVRDSRVIFAELKSDRGRLSGDQQDWMAALMAVADADRWAHVEAYIWKPADWPLVEEMLR